MAGIGYRLKALVKEDTFTNLFKGYLYSAVISSGPWLFTVLCLWLLNVVFGDKGHPFGVTSYEEGERFRITVIYVYAFSLVITGFFQMVISRYLSDRLFADDSSKVIPSFISALAITASIQLVLGVGFCTLTEFPPVYKVMAVTLYIVVSCIWIAMIFLGAARDYNSIFIAFLTGTVVSFGAAFVLGHYYGQNGLMTGFTAGQLLILAMLVARTLSEFDGAITMSPDVVRYFNAFPRLALIGFFYNLGIWVDKFFFMFGPAGTKVAPMFYDNPAYTTPLFVAYLTIVPTLSLFVIRVETSFHDVYQKYYGTIVAKAPLHRIEQVRLEMAENIRLSASRVLKLQGTISLLAIIFSDSIATATGMLHSYIPVFRVAVLASLLQALLLILVITLLYLDQRSKVLWLSTLFFITNGLFSYMSLQLGYSYWGFGYAASCLVSVIVGYLLLDRSVSKLTYYTFMHQPVKPVVE